jgi:uncharacterized protein
MEKGKRKKGIMDSMNKKQEIQEALTTAMKARDDATKRTLRLVMSAIKMAEVEEGGEIEDARILRILQKEVKTREDSIEEAQNAARDDLVAAAREEKEILNQFLPQQLSHDELTQLAKATIEETGAESMRDMGRVMNELMPKLNGRASGQEASQVVRQLLQK